MSHSIGRATLRAAGYAPGTDHDLADVVEVGAARPR
jgi:hypothetical protein